MIEMSVTSLSSELPRRAKLMIGVFLLCFFAAFAMIVFAAAGVTHDLLMPAVGVLAVVTILVVGVFPSGASLYRYVRA